MGKQDKVTLKQLRQLVRESITLLEARTLDVSALEKEAKSASEQLLSIGVDLYDPDVEHDVRTFVKSVGKSDYQDILRTLKRAQAAWMKLYTAVSRHAHTRAGKADFEIQDLYDQAANAVDVCHEYIDDLEYYFGDDEEENWSDGGRVAKEIYDAAYNAYMSSQSQLPEDAFAGAKKAANRLSKEFPFLRKSIYWGEGAFPMILNGVKNHNTWERLSNKAKKSIEDALRQS